MPESWPELAKQFTLWESQRGGNVELMLQRTKTNSRVNEQMAKWVVSVQGITGNWHGKYKDLWGDIFGKVQDQYLNLDAFSRNQAIELAAAVAKANAPAAPGGEEHRRGGLLGLLGIGG